MAEPVPVSHADAILPAQAVIRRTFSDAEELRLIRIAESVPPDPAAVRAVASRLRGPLLPPGDSVWWIREVSGIRIPFAVTDAAVAYYWDIYRRLEEGRAQRFSVPMRTVDLRYDARVDPLDRFEVGDRVFRDVRTVHLALHFSAVCGMQCGAGFTHTRQITLTRGGEVLAVDGDGRPRGLNSP